ncbi:hypothetical protein [Desulfocurvus sp. DL9XJH121]
MRLSVQLSGYKDEVVVSALPRAFLAKVVRHCYGKNNTPYFAHNCFKGVLYFDEGLCRKFAQATGYDWKGWWEEDRFHHRTAYVLDESLTVRVLADGEEVQELAPLKLATAETPVRPAALLPEVADHEVLVLMGSMDKGEAVWTLEGFSGDFNPARLSVAVETFAGFGLEDRLVTGLSYGGANLVPGPEASKGKRMIEPALISPDGADWDLDDIIAGLPEDLPPQEG